MEGLYLDDLEVGQDGGLPIAGGIISTSGELMWTNPVRPGDTLLVECECWSAAAARNETADELGLMQMILMTLSPSKEIGLALYLHSSAFICGSILVVHRGDSCGGHCGGP